MPSQFVKTPSIQPFLSGLWLSSTAIGPGGAPRDSPLHHGSQRAREQEDRRIRQQAGVSVTGALSSLPSSTNSSPSPKFTIALVRTPKLSPYHARFQVPLNFSKYDLRDYLYHAYDVKCHNIRSFVKQQPIRMAAKTGRHQFRPESLKYMTVEMERPFVWPEDPESWEPWDKEEGVEGDREYPGSMVRGELEKERDKLIAKREQARRILGLGSEGEAGEEAGEGKEVERDSSPLERWEKRRTAMALGRESA